MSEEREYVTEIWTYAGRRLDRKNKLFYLWIDGEGNQYLFNKFKGNVIGGDYAVQANHDDGTAVRGTPVFQAAGEEPGIPTWDAADRAAYTADLTRKREAKAKRDGDGWTKLSLRQYRRDMAHAPPMQRAAMLAQLLRYLGAA